MNSLNTKTYFLEYLLKQEAQETFEEESEFPEEKEKAVITEGEKPTASKEVEEQKPAEDRLVTLHRHD